MNVHNPIIIDKIIDTELSIGEKINKEIEK